MREMSVKATEKREEREFFLFSAEKAMNKGHVWTNTKRSFARFARDDTFFIPLLVLSLSPRLLKARKADAFSLSLSLSLSLFLWKYFNTDTMK